MKTTIISVCLLIASQVAAHTGTVDNGVVTLTKITDGVYAVAPEFTGSSATVIINSDSVIVVDTHGTPATAEALLDAIGELTHQPVRYVINTHWHTDHHSGNQAYRDAFGNGVSFIAHEQTRIDIPTLGAGQFAQTAPYRSGPIDRANKKLTEADELTDAQVHQIEKFSAAQTEFVENADSFEFLLPDITISKKLTIHGKPNKLEIFFLHKAHTAGDLVVYLPASRTLVVADILTKPILWSWSSYPYEYVKTLKALEQLDVEHLVIGHGGPVLDGTSYLVTVRRFLEAVTTFTDQALSRGIDIDTALAEAANAEQLQAFRSEFVSDNEQENAMYSQMVGWTVTRAFEEKSELAASP